MLYRAALNFQSVLSLILGSLLLGAKGESARYAATHNGTDESTDNANNCSPKLC